MKSQSSRVVLLVKSPVVLARVIMLEKCGQILIVIPLKHLETINRIKSQCFLQFSSLMSLNMDKSFSFLGQSSGHAAPLREVGAARLRLRVRGLRRGPLWGGAATDRQAGDRAGAAGGFLLYKQVCIPNMIPMTHIYIYGSCIIYFYITYTYLYMIHVLYIYHLSTHIWIHLGCFGGKCAYIFHTWSIWDHNFDIKRINIPVEIFVTKSEASGPLQNGFWLPFCAKFWPWVLPSCKWTPPGTGILHWKCEFVTLQSRPFCRSLEG